MIEVVFEKKKQDKSKPHVSTISTRLEVIRLTAELITKLYPETKDFTDSIIKQVDEIINPVTWYEEDEPGLKLPLEKSNPTG